MTPWIMLLITVTMGPVPGTPRVTIIHMTEERCRTAAAMVAQTPFDPAQPMHRSAFCMPAASLAEADQIRG